MRVLDPRVAELAKLHDTRLAISFGDYAGAGFVRVDDSLILTPEGGCYILPDGLCGLNGVDDHLYAKSNLGLLDTDDLAIVVGSTQPDASQKGCIVKIGDASTGLGLGLGSGDFETAGNELIALQEGVAWVDRNVSVGAGFSTVGIFSRREAVDGNKNYIYHYTNGYNVGGEYFPKGNTIQPTSDLFIGGYDASAAGGGNRHATAKIHFVIIARNRNQGSSYAMDDLITAAADLFPAGTYVPWQRTRLISLPPPAPSISQTGSRWYYEQIGHHAHV